jgi:hypothetical protein
MRQNPFLACIPLSLRILKITQIPLLKPFALLHSRNHVFPSFVSISDFRAFIFRLSDCTGSVDVAGGHRAIYLTKMSQ